MKTIIIDDLCTIDEQDRAIIGRCRERVGATYSDIQRRGDASAKLGSVIAKCSGLVGNVQIVSYASVIRYGGAERAVHRVKAEVRQLRCRTGVVDELNVEPTVIKDVVAVLIDACAAICAPARYAGSRQPH